MAMNPERASASDWRDYAASLERELERYRSGEQLPYGARKFLWGYVIGGATVALLLWVIW